MKKLSLQFETNESIYKYGENDHIDIDIQYDESEQTVDINFDNIVHYDYGYEDSGCTHDESTFYIKSCDFDQLKKLYKFLKEIFENEN